MTDKRLFFALWPDPQQAQIIANGLGPVARQVSGKPVSRGNWHVTLVFIGPFPQARIAELMAAAATIRTEPFGLRFDRLSFWQKPRIGCLLAPVVPHALQELVSALSEVLEGFSIELQERTYRPHITAVRKAEAFEPIVLAQPLALRWSGFELVESIRLPGGVQYSPLKQQLLLNT